MNVPNYDVTLSVNHAKRIVVGDILRVRNGDGNAWVYLRVITITAAGKEIQVFVQAKHPKQLEVIDPSNGWLPAPEEKELDPDDEPF